MNKSSPYVLSSQDVQLPNRLINRLLWAISGVN